MFRFTSVSGTYGRCSKTLGRLPLLLLTNVSKVLGQMYKDI